MVLGTGSSGLAGPIGTGVLGTKQRGVVGVFNAPAATIVGNFSSRNEGSAVIYTITVANVAAGTTLYWVMRTTTGTALAADFTDATLSGSYSLAVGLVNTITRTWRNDITTEGAEIWVMDIKTGSITGTVIGTSSPATTIADTSVGISATNLYCHYDWSRVTGTSWGGGAVAQTTLVTAGGTAIGLASTTPALSVVTQANNPLTSNILANGNRYLSFDTTKYAYTVSGGAFPQITSSGYAFFEARQFTTAPGDMVNTSHWAYSYYNTVGYAAWLTYGTQSIYHYVNQLNTSGYDSYAAVTVPASRSSTSVVHTYAMNIVGNTNTFTWTMCSGSSTVYSGSGQFPQGVTYGTTTSAQRMFYLNLGIPVTKGAFRAMEYGFYSAPLSTADLIAVSQRLYNKWAA